MALIATFDGSMAERSKCRKIQDQFYEENRQCFLMEDGKWHRINNGRITKEYRSGNHVFISNRLSEGVVGRNPDGSFKIGFFEKEPAKDVTLVSDGLVMRCINREVLEGSDAEECYGDGSFVMGNHKFKGVLKAKRIFRTYPFDFDYRCSRLLPTFTDSFNKYFNGKKLKNEFHKFLPKVTFGIEYETSNGRIPDDLILQNGLIPVRDGSLHNEEGTQPYEYATIILSGETGLKAVNNHSELLNKYCVNDYRNSLHVHIGNIPLSREYVYSLYLVAMAIEKEIYSMFPAAMAKTSTFKKRDYCMPLAQIKFKKDSFESNFDSLYRYLSMASRSFDGFEKKHPADPDGRAKWNVETRYTWLNFIPLLFGSTKTAEFRVHTSTFDNNKIANWIFIISAICQYSYEHREENRNLATIKDFSLAEILSEIYGTENKLLYEYLLEYIDYRKKLMLKFQQMGDTVGAFDVKHDNTEEFTFPIKSLVICD